MTGASELLLLVGLGYVVLGHKRMQKLVSQVARAKAQFEKTRQEFQSQLDAELGGAPKDT